MRIARGFCWISVLVLFFGLTTVALPGRTAAQVVVSVSFGPPELPVYEQPLCPGDGYIWTPGYWDWDPDADDYFWVPGTWVLPPQVGFLWTPGYWGWNGAAFVFNEGYWGPVVGFYGGINYGFGYFGHGYEGGRWDHDHFYYNRSVNNVNITQIHNVYNTRIINNNSTRVSYNGGNGGITTRPSSEELAAAHERHVGPVSQQVQHVQAARADQSLRASQNHGKPPIAATPRPAAFSEHGVVAAREGGKYNPPPRGNGDGNHGSPSGAANRPNEAPPAHSSNPRPVIHPNDAPPHENLPAPNTGNPKLDQKYQQQQEKLRAKQEQEHQKLQQKQDQEHQKALKQQANEAQKQQMEQRHQQQTQQMEQRHTQQLQKLQQHQQQAAPHPNPGKPPHS